MKTDSARAPFDIINSGAHWRMRAEEIRTLADDAEEATARTMMLRIAADYDRPAKWAEDRSPATRATPEQACSRARPRSAASRIFSPGRRIHNRLCSIDHDGRTNLVRINQRRTPSAIEKPDPSVKNKRATTTTSTLE
jgi:hypothetical protein